MKKLTPRQLIESKINKKFYLVFWKIKNRCNDKKNKEFKYYGKRGIKCEWKSFEEFKKDMYKSFLLHNKRYGGRNTSIDRIDNNGNYCKENCRWATYKEQSRNKRSNVYIVFDGKRMIINDWAIFLNIKHDTLYARIKKGGDLKNIFFTPVKIK